MRDWAKRPKVEEEKVLSLAIVILFCLHQEIYSPLCKSIERVNTIRLRLLSRNLERWLICCKFLKRVR